MKNKNAYEEHARIPNKITDRFEKITNSIYLILENNTKGGNILNSELKSIKSQKK